MQRTKKYMNASQSAISINALKKAVSIVGSQVKLGKAIGRSSSTINDMIKGRLEVTFKNSIKIERITGGSVKRSQLRPDEDFF